MNRRFSWFQSEELGCFGSSLLSASVCGGLAVVEWFFKGFPNCICWGFREKGRISWSNIWNLWILCNRWIYRNSWGRRRQWKIRILASCTRKIHCPEIWFFSVQNKFGLRFWHSGFGLNGENLQLISILRAIFVSALMTFATRKHLTSDVQLVVVRIVNTQLRHLE